MSEAKARAISVCFPAYNEAVTLSGVLVHADFLLRRSGLEYEIVVCNDGSTDSTASIAEACASRLEHVRVIHNARNLGIRQTFERLYTEARNEIVFLNSTDGQWPTEVIFKMLPLMDQCDIVVAARRRKHYGWGRSTISFLFNLVPLVLFGARTYDAGAVKLVRKDVIRLTPVISRSPFSEAERLIRASRLGFQVSEIIVDISPRVHGSSHAVPAGVLVEACRDVFRVWWDLKRHPLARQAARSQEDWITANAVPREAPLVR